MRDKVERLESEKAAVDQSLVSTCEERDELQKMVNDLQTDLDKTQEALQQVRLELVPTTRFEVCTLKQMKNIEVILDYLLVFPLI